MTVIYFRTAMTSSEVETTKKKNNLSGKITTHCEKHSPKECKPGLKALMYKMTVVQDCPDPNDHIETILITALWPTTLAYY